MVAMCMIHVSSGSRWIKSAKEMREEASDVCFDGRSTGHHDSDIVFDARQCVPKASAWVGKMAIPEINEEFDPDDTDHRNNPAERENKYPSQLSSGGHA